MDTSEVPADVAAAIKQCWPNGVVEEFATDESYFHEVRPRLERDLRNIRGAALLWQTEEEEIGARSNEDENDGPLRSGEWQSYHVFFLAPESKEFRFEDETAGIEEPEDPEQPTVDSGHVSGEGWIGCAVGICLAAPYSVINLSNCSRYDDGTMSTPEVESFIYSEETSERVDTDQYHRETLTREAFQKLEALRGEIASILVQHRIQVLEEAVLNLHVPGLKTSPEVFLEEPLRIRDAFFFRGA